MRRLDPLLMAQPAPQRTLQEVKVTTLTPAAGLIQNRLDPVE
jgi:hypothetical protein